MNRSHTPSTRTRRSAGPLIILALAGIALAGCAKAPPPAPVAQDPITATCSGNETVPDPLIAIDGNGVHIPITCTVVHGEVTLPVGVHLIECPRGSLAAPYPESYRLHPNGQTYAVNCIVGQVVDLGVHGGRLQVVCPAESTVSFYHWGLTGGAVEMVPPNFPPPACNPGDLVPGNGVPLDAFVDSIDWNVSPWILGLVKCPADGSLEVYFLGEGAPTTSPGAATSYTCAAGDPVDVTGL